MKSKDHYSCKETKSHPLHVKTFQLWGSIHHYGKLGEISEFDGRANLLYPVITRVGSCISCSKHFIAATDCYCIITVISLTLNQPSPPHTHTPLPSPARHCFNFLNILKEFIAVEDFIIIELRQDFCVQIRLEFRTDGFKIDLVSWRLLLPQADM